ncbi:MAG: hypothetical protein V2I33_16285 [Kangiellaceae bacterium]|nr:hypothetical protein [Kangiellaceae bacterium]
MATGDDPTLLLEYELSMFVVCSLLSLLWILSLSSMLKTGGGGDLAVGRGTGPGVAGATFAASAYDRGNRAFMEASALIKAGHS